MKSHSLLELSESIQRVVQRTFNSSYWVRAEISRLNYYPKSGHCYPELVEKTDGKIVAEIRSTIWKSVYFDITSKFKTQTGEELKEGMKILFLVQVKYSPTHGVSLNILDIDPSFSLGEMAKEKLASIKYLKENNLFDLNRSLEIPYLPNRLAIISVSTSKGYQDFLETIEKKGANFSLKMDLFPAILQGDVGVTSITEQLELIKKSSSDFDLVLIIRGGGGDVGLHCYNHLLMAETVATFPIPVITGIGHSTNETVVEMVANTNRITPTAVADGLIEHFRNLEQELVYAAQTVFNIPKNILEPQKQALLNQIQFLKSHTTTPLHNEKMVLEKITNRISKSSQIRFSLERANLEHKTIKPLTYWSLQTIKRSKSELNHLNEKVGLLNPKNVLKRGFSISTINNKVVNSVGELSNGQEMETIFYDGKVESIIKKTIKNG